MRTSVSGLLLFLFLGWGLFWILPPVCTKGAMTAASNTAIQQASAPASSASSTLDDWPMERHDSRNTGLSADQVAPPLRLLWKVNAHFLSSTLLSSGGVVAVTRATNDARGTREISLYDKTGRCVWQYANATPYYIKDSRIVAGVQNGDRSIPTCLDWRANKVVWSQPKASWTASGTVMAKDGRFYIAPYSYGSEKAVLWMLDLKNGQVLQERSIPDGWSGDLAYDGEHLFWSTRQWMHVLDARSLERQWAYYGVGHVHPLRIGPLLITQGVGHGTGALDLTTRKYTWGIRAWRGSAHALAVGPGGRKVLIEALPSPEEVVALDVTTGKILWRHSLIVTTYSDTPAAGSGHFVYVPGWHRFPEWRRPNTDGNGIRGGFYCLDAATGKLKWKYEKPGIYGKSIIVSEGRVYALDNEGTLYCFAPSSR